MAFYRNMKCYISGFEILGIYQEANHSVWHYLEHNTLSADARVLKNDKLSIENQNENDANKKENQSSLQKLNVVKIMFFVGFKGRA